MDAVLAEAASEVVITGKAIPEVVTAVVEAEVVDMEEAEEVVVVEVTVEVVTVEAVVGTEAGGTATVAEVTLEIQLGNSVRVRGKQLVISSV